MRDSLRPWVLAARPRTLPAASVPVLVGTGAAVHTGHFQPGPALAALAGALLIQIGANFANDVSDFKKGADTAERLGPTRVTQAGLLSARQVTFGAAFVFGLAVLIGFYLVWVGGWPIVAIGLASIVAAITYVGGPLPYGYRGMGDLFVFLFFGLAAVVGTYYVQAKATHPVAWWAAAPIGLLATAILVVNNLRDIDTDRQAGKRTLAVIFGRRATRAEYAVLLTVAYLIPPAMVGLRLASYFVLLPWISVPIALGLNRRIRTTEGRPLNPVLGETARLELIYGVLFAIGLIVPGPLL